VKTFQQFIGEAYSKSEKESHKVKPVKKEFFIKKAPIDMNYRKYNMPIKPATFPKSNPYKVTEV
tara:strand:+ start:795 stop:986 length:192 start_codon:yes stop_codon:yes gene_type:complete